MATITWNKSLSVQIDSIDEQHKKLIDLINSFYENINQGSNKEKISEMIRSLKNYTIFHFSTEEKYMKKFDYPEFNNHKLEHDKFIESVLNFEERYKSGKLLLSIEITSFIKDWITNHIMGTDKRYSDYFIKHGVK
jgi:hemerythrin-like metal-binding protein